MKSRRFSLQDYIVWGILAVAGILFACSLTAGRIFNSSRGSAQRASKAIEKRMEILDGFMTQSLEGGRDTWIGNMDLPDDMVIYRYYDDSLKSWCNQFPVRNDDIRTKMLFQKITRPNEDFYSPLTRVTEEVSYVNYGEKWYLVKSAAKGACKVIGGLEIIDSMDDDENPNGINRNLHLSNDCSIIGLSESGGSPVMLGERPLFKVVDYNHTGSNVIAHSTLVWLAILFFILASLLHLRNKRSFKRLSVVLPALLLVIFAAFIWGESIKDSSKLFSPIIYADGIVFNSLGAVLICSLAIILCICSTFFVRDDIYRRILESKKPRRALELYLTVILLLAIGLIAYVFIIFKSIIFNSNITLELYRLNELTVFSLLVYVLLTALLLMLPLLFQMAMPAFKRLFGWNFKGYSVTSRAITAIVFALYMVITASTLGFRKEQDRVTVWANRLSMDRDITLELELRLQEDKIAADQYITQIAPIQNSEYLIRNRIVENQFSRLAQDYDIAVEMFHESDKTQEAVDYFTSKVTNGTPIDDGSRFRYLRETNGDNSYVGSFAYYNPASGVTMMLVTVSPKSNREDRGYASILGYSAPGEVLIPARYSYAKYSTGNLTSYRGNYPYPTILKGSTKDELVNAPNGIARIGGYTHFINQINDDEMILISRAKIEFSNYMVTFLFITLTFYFCLSLFSLTRKGRKKAEKNYYKSRITAAMMIALIMTLIAMAAVSVLFVYKRNNANLHSSMADKINSIQTLVQSRCRFAQDYTDLNSTESANILDDVSNTMKTDITLYTTSGKEFKSTTPEIFERMMLVSRINQKAYENIIYRSRSYYIGKETIGTKNCYFLYAPVFNAQNKMIAILSSPYTDESFDFKSEAVLHCIMIITVFMILLILARLITATAVDKMFKPLSEMGRKMNEASIDNLEYIVYERDDEVSSLVRAYNLMVHDLYNSTKQLTQNERDKAWATMARQVAHEIKNPLTPIKLQIQRLIRLKSNGNPVWADRFDDISQEVLKQIDLLADTANEFSTFAKLYTEESVEIDLDALIKEEIDLFDSKENITFSYMGLDGAKVHGPKPQLTRVITNLISNSVQAIENAQTESAENGLEPVPGMILVSLRISSKEGFYDIVFEDNGPGVSDENRSRLFTPNFTTKNTGTGLGLAICRNILEKCNGDIQYSRSFTLKGACFTVRFPRS